LTLIPTPSPRPFHLSKPENALHCGKVSLEALVKRYGTPLYVYSADQIAERLGLFQQALEGREHLVCYAVKANSAAQGSTLSPAVSWSVFLRPRPRRFPVWCFPA
jgi:diaminopimelate decarboxylase